MGAIKLAASMAMLFLFVTIGRLNVSDDMIWIGLCILCSAWIMHETVIKQTYIEEDEDEE